MAHKSALVFIYLLRLWLLHSWLHQFLLVIAKPRLDHDFGSFNGGLLSILVVKRIVEVWCFLNRLNRRPLSIIRRWQSFVRFVDACVFNRVAQFRNLFGYSCEWCYRSRRKSLNRHPSFLLVWLWSILSRSSTVTLTLLHQKAERCRLLLLSEFLH